MKKQLIISLGREYGSGGHVIAQMLADHYQIPLYNYNLMRNIADEKNLDANELEKYDEKRRNKVFSRTVKGYSNSPEDNICKMQFDYLRKKSSEGESFVIVGRCAEEILKDNPIMISIFILADMDFKVRRTMEDKSLSWDDAQKKVLYCNRERKGYHNSYCKGKWGDSRNYELSINSSKLGLEETAEIIIQYIDKKLQKSL